MGAQFNDRSYACRSMRIDLHTHSTASDGTTPPAVLMREARDAGLDVVALVDHDTTAGWATAVEALPAGLTLVRGAEISCTTVVEGRTVSLHLLAYLFDPEEPAFAARRLALRDSRLGRAQAMVRLLAADGVDVSWEQVRARAGGVVGRPHIASALMAAGLVATVSDAFTPEWIGTRGRYWVGKLELDVLDALRLVRGAGGLPVFAHPFAASRGRIVGDDVVRAMAAAGLAGLEVDHPDHDEVARARARQLALELDLVPTGSSDYHGANKVQGLGAETTTPAAYDALLALGSALDPVHG